jgi:hypothetical protein
LATWNQFLDTDAQEKQSRGIQAMMWAAFCGITKSQAIYVRGDPDSPKHGVTGSMVLQRLQQHLQALMAGEGRVFMQDGASVHTANGVYCHEMACLEPGSEPY